MVHSALHLCILVDQQTSALEHTLANLPAELQQIQLFSLSDTVQAHAHPVTQLHWSDSIQELRQQVLAQTAYPCLLLEAGETLSPESWQALEKALVNQTATSLACVVQRPDRIEVSPRLFFKPSEVQVGTVLALSESPLPVLSDCQIQAQQVSLFYQQDDERQLWLERLSQAGELSADACFAKGLYAFQQHRDEEALALFKQLSEESEPGIWQTLGQVMYLKALWESQQHPKAFELLDRFRQQNPSLEQNPSLWVLRGVMAKQLKQTELAMDCFSQALAFQERDDFFLANPLVLVPDITWKPTLGLAEIELGEGLFAQALKHFQAVLQALPGHDYVLAGLLKSAFFTRRYDLVQEVLTQAPELRGLSALSLQALQLFLKLEQGQSVPDRDAQVQALMVSKEKLSSDPLLTSVLLELSILLLRQQAHTLARPMLNLLVSLLPDQALLGHNLAYSYFAEGDFAKAEAHYRKVLAVSPHFFESQFDLAKTLVMQNRQDEAMVELKALLQANPHFARARQALQELEARELDSYLPPEPRTQADASDVDMPFIFVFPLDPSWENGLDIALKAYYQEFVPEEQVLFVLPMAQETPIVEAARVWAEQQHGPEFLPPVALLAEALPLLETQSAWVLPWRLQPAADLLAQIEASTYPLLSTDMPLQQPQGQTLPMRLHAEASGNQRKIWKETDVVALQNQMRLAYLGEIRGAAQPRPASTHDFIGQAAANSGQEMPASELEAQTPAQNISLGVCMIVRNEAATLERCLDSIHEDVDEIIVVDTGSEDQTRELARRYPKVKLSSFTWSDDFAAARNQSLEQASTDWILTLDADEYVEAGFISSLRYFLALPQQPDSYAFPVLAVDANGQVDPEHSLMSVPRLFPNHPAYRYRGQVHEMIYHAERPSLKYFLMRQLPIYHTGYQAEVRLQKQKTQRDIQLMEKLIQEAPDAPETARIYAILASIKQKNQDPKGALVLYEQGLKTVVSDPMIRSVLQTGRFQSWLQEAQYDEVLAHSAEAEPEARLSLFVAEACLQSGQPEQALHWASQALLKAERSALEPDPLSQHLPRTQILAFMAQICEKINDLDGAVYFLKRCLKGSTDPIYRQRYQKLLASLPAEVI